MIVNYVTCSRKTRQQREKIRRTDIHDEADQRIRYCIKTNGFSVAQEAQKDQIGVVDEKAKQGAADYRNGARDERPNSRPVECDGKTNPLPSRPPEQYSGGNGIAD